MKKSNPRIKAENVITIKDKINAIETIANAYFHKFVDENNNTIIEYTPYHSEIAQIITIMKFFIDGVEFDKDESIYDSASQDPQLCNIIKQFMSTDTFEQIIDTVKDIVEYKKSENIAKIQNESNSVLANKLIELIEKEHEKALKETDAIDNLNRWINEQRELNSLITPEMQRNFAENFDISALTDSIIKKYTESDLYERNREVTELSRQLRGKDNKIIELKNELARKEQKENVINVVADK